MIQLVYIIPVLLVLFCRNNFELQINPHVRGLSSVTPLMQSISNFCPNMFCKKSSKRWWVISMSVQLYSNRYWIFHEVHRLWTVCIPVWNWTADLKAVWKGGAAGRFGGWEDRVPVWGWQRGNEASVDWYTVTAGTSVMVVVGGNSNWLNNRLSAPTDITDLGSPGFRVDSRSPNLVGSNGMAAPVQAG